MNNLQYNVLCVFNEPDQTNLTYNDQGEYEQDIDENDGKCDVFNLITKLVNGDCEN